MISKYLQAAPVAACLTACVLGFGTAAEAAQVTFNLGGTNNNASSFTFSSGGLTLTATAFDGSTPVDVRRINTGLGVVGQGDGTTNNLRNQIEGNESLILTLSQNARILSATFAALQDNDGFALSVDGTQIFQANTFITNPATFDDNFGSVFRFTAPEANDDYRLQAVTFETIPEPLTILGSTLAVGFGVALKRQAKKRQEA